MSIYISLTEAKRSITSLRVCPASSRARCTDTCARDRANDGQMPRITILQTLRVLDEGLRQAGCYSKIAHSLRLVFDQQDGQGMHEYAAARGPNAQHQCIPRRHTIEGMATHTVRVQELLHQQVDAHIVHDKPTRTDSTEDIDGCPKYMENDEDDCI